MGKVRGRFVVLLDLDRTLSIDELAALADLPADPSAGG